MAGYVYRGNQPWKPEGGRNPDGTFAPGHNFNRDIRRGYATDPDQLTRDLLGVTKQLDKWQRHQILTNGRRTVRTCPECGALHATPTCDICPLLEAQNGTAA